MAKLAFYGPTGSNDDNTNHFIKITPGLYIVEENNNLYASTTRPTSIPSHPNRSYLLLMTF